MKTATRTTTTYGTSSWLDYDLLAADPKNKKEENKEEEKDGNKGGEG
jgi:hypothetical protein